MTAYESHDSVFHRICFELYSPAEIRQISTKEITNKECFDKISGLSISGGLYDPQLGPINERDVCMSCHLNYSNCPGHLSHIEFPKPIYNPALFEQMMKIFKLTCITCYRLPSDDVSKVLLKNLSKLPRSPSQWEIYRKSYDDCMKYMNKLATRQCLACGNWRPPVMHKLKQEICITAAASERWHKSNAKRQRERIMDMQATKRMKLMDGGALLKHEVEEAKDEDRIEEAEMDNFQVTEIDKMEEDENELDETEDKSDKIGGRQKILLPSEVRLHLRKLYANESKTILTLFPFLYNFTLHEKHKIEEYKETSGRTRQRTIPTDMFFMECMLVPPPSCRPPSKDHARGGGLFMHPRTTNLQRVLIQAQTLRSVLETSVHKAVSTSVDPHQPMTTDLNSSGVVSDTPAVSTKSVVTHCLIGLQKAVNCCLDYDLDRQTATRQPGLKQLLDSKKGLLRMNMMGKRVNYACRSVISPDPYLAVDEVGLPEVFAMKLTFPEAVNSTNVQHLSELVMNGPSVYPGAVWVEKPNGDKLKIPLAKGSREALAKSLMAPEIGKGATRVYRHLQDGDPMIMNRQPTLHRPSMQVHRARVLRIRSAKTIRMHYANCKAYNADFDGDEMNGHYVQTYDAKAEAIELASVPHQYLVPKDGTPLAGLIQDHIIAAVKLTMRDRFITRPEYLQLVYTGLHRFGQIRRIVLLPPAIIKPARLWTGKQVISTLLINLTPENISRVNLNIRGKASKITLWIGKGSKLRDMTDIDLVVRDGQLLAGILDKAHIGPSQFGLLHCFHEAHGPMHATRLLSAITSVLNAFLQKVGFSLGIKDLLLTERVNKKRRRGFRKIAVEGVCAFAKTFNLSPEELTPETTTELYRRAHFSRRGNFAKKIEELDRNVKMMVKTAQEDITGISIPNGLEVKFPQNNLQLMINSGAKGGQLNALQISVCLGQIELEGKRVPMMLSGRTLPCFRPYDVSPRAGGLCTYRFLTGLPPQELFFHSMAGRDGLIDTAVKTSRSGYLQRSLIKHLEGLMVHYDCTVRESHGEVIQFQYGDDGLDVTKTPFLKQLPFFAENAPIFDKSLQDLNEIRDMMEENGSHRKLRRMWKKIDRHGVDRTTETVYSDVRGDHVVRMLPPPDTVLSRFLPNVNPGAISEQLREDIKKASITLKSDIKPRTFERLIHAKCQNSTAQPGDPVGLLAAQSLGEPSTQMTLNTFHFAGRGEMNVTLGIPRLREILMVGAVNIKTPCMELPVLNTLQAQQRVKHVILPRFNKILLRDLVTDISCVFDPINEDYRITLHFVRSRELREKWPMLDGEKLLSYMETKFFDEFGKVLHRFEKAVKTESVTQALSSAVVGNRRRRSSDEEAAGGDVAAKEEVEDDEDEEGPVEEAKREWNVEMDGAEAVAKKGWAGSDDEDGDERDFEGEEEEELEVLGGEEVKAVPEDEFDEVLVVEEEKRVKLLATRNCVLLDATDVDDGESEEEGTRKAHRAMRVTRLHSSYRKYDFRCKKKIWCRLTVNTSSKMGIRCDLESLITSEVDKAVVYSLKNIEKAILDTENSNQWVVRTEGINFAEVYREPTVFDLDRVYTNNIHVMMHTYGVEAGRATICKEVSDVFKHYGIVVDPRHLSLVGDYMTHSGGYRAFNRHGMANHASPLQRMSFETTTKVLRESLLMGQSDTLATPSSAIVMGSIVQHSRSLFELLVPIKTYLKY